MNIWHHIMKNFHTLGRTCHKGLMFGSSSIQQCQSCSSHAGPTGSKIEVSIWHHTKGGSCHRDVRSSSSCPATPLAHPQWKRGRDEGRNLAPYPGWFLSQRCQIFDPPVQQRHSLIPNGSEVGTRAGIWHHTQGGSCHRDVRSLILLSSNATRSSPMEAR